MQNQPSSPPKPVTDWWRPDLVKLPKLTFTRRSFRIFMRGVAKLVVFMTLNITVKGMENENIYNRKWWQHARVTLSVGKPFQLEEQIDRQKMMRDGTGQIMESLASLLPESYLGNYKVNQT